MGRGMRQGISALLLWGLLAPPLAWPDAFSDARQAVRITVGQSDLSGFSMRGGAALTIGVPPGNAVLLRGSATVGKPCSGFDFATSMQQAFEEIPELLEGLIQQLIANMPMLVLCYTSPTLCDLAKNFQNLINMLIQSRYAQCNQIQVGMAYSGLRLRGGQIGHCLESEANAGTPLSTAMQRCTAGMSQLRLPSGLMGDQMSLVQDTLQAAGATTEIQTLAGALLGDVTMRTGNGGLSVAQTRPRGAMLARYEQHRLDTSATLHEAVEELRTTGTVSPLVLQTLAVPGQPLPRVALDALVALRSDPARYENHVQKLATNLSVTRLTWECGELQDQLAGSIEGNQHLSAEERLLLERRLTALDRELKAVIAKKDVIEQHMQPALDALLREYTQVQAVATEAGLSAPRPAAAAMPFGTQAPSGMAQ